MPPTYHRSSGYAKHKMPQPYKAVGRRPGGLSASSKKAGQSGGRGRGGGTSGSAGSFDLVSLSSQSLSNAGPWSGDAHPEERHRSPAVATYPDSARRSPDRAAFADVLSRPDIPVVFQRLQFQPQLKFNGADSQFPATAPTLPLSSPPRGVGLPLQFSPSHHHPQSAAALGRSSTPVLQLTPVRPPASSGQRVYPLDLTNPSTTSLMGGLRAPTALVFERPQRKPQSLTYEMLDDDESDLRSGAGAVLPVGELSYASNFAAAHTSPSLVDVGWPGRLPARVEAEPILRQPQLIYDDDYDDGAVEDVPPAGAFQPQHAFSEPRGGFLQGGRSSFEMQDLSSRLPMSPSPRFTAAAPSLPSVAEEDAASPLFARSAPVSHGVPPARDQASSASHFLPGHLSEEEHEEPVTIGDLAKASLSPLLEQDDASHRPPLMAPQAHTPHAQQLEAAGRSPAPAETSPFLERQDQAGSQTGAADRPAEAHGGMIQSQYGSFIGEGWEEEDQPSQVPARLSSAPVLAADALKLSPASVASDQYPLSPISAARFAKESAARPPSNTATQTATVRHRHLTLLYRRYPSRFWRSRRPSAQQTILGQLMAKPVPRPGWKQYGAGIRALWLRANEMGW